MELNTAESIKLGREVHRAFGSWKKAREAATRTDDGVYRINLENIPKSTVADASR